tara:strand:+ start:685 stop:1863 length:1179 start_codon:yes stop_codon:yes gene_type:complete
MHHFIYPTKTTWISSGSRKTDGKAFTEQNFGKDEILELKKEFYNLSFDYPTRVMLQFDLTNISESINSGEILSPSLGENTGSKFYLKLYEAEGNQEQSSDYNITGNAISESWDEGRGKFGSDPQVKDGASWNFRKFPVGGSGISWTTSGSSFISQSGFDVSQSFSSSKPDIEMDITRIARAWLSGSAENVINADVDEMQSPVSGGIANNGILLSFSGSQETNSETFGQLKFFSRNTNTIYSPKLEVRWDDHKPVTGSNTGSLLQITSSGLADNYIYEIRNKGTYKEDEKVKFRFGARKRYIQKTFSTSVQEVSGSFIPEGSGSYSIVDIATGETIVPFSSYTSMSCDETSNYFVQWLNGFETDRYYKILIKVKYDDNQEHIFDDDFEFKIKG